MSIIQDPHGITYSGKETMEYILRPAITMTGLETYIKILTGVKVKQQVAFISQLDKLTIKDTGCDPQYGDKQPVRSEKYWNPEPVEAALRQCYADLKGTSMETQLNGGTTRPYLVGTEVEKLLLSLMVPAANRDYQRMMWLSKKAINASELTNGNADVKYYDQVDGFFTKIKTAVVAGLTPRHTISQNTATTTAGQELPDGEAKTILRNVYKKSRLVLKQYADKDKVFFVTRSIYDNYSEGFEDNDVRESAYLLTINGTKTLTYKGIPLVIMDVVDTYLQSDFNFGTGANATVTEPHRVVLTVKDNFQSSLDTDTTDPVAFDAWDEKKEKRWYARAMYKMDTQIALEELVSVAY